jgi:WD40 repeat protein/tRNA A-37 threonylcarbamoyl transferase component Bud32
MLGAAGWGPQEQNACSFLVRKHRFRIEQLSSRHSMTKLIRLIILPMWSPSMHDISSHPSAGRLNAYLLGKLSDEDCAGIERHLAECQQCFESSTELQPRDTLMELLTAAAKSTTAEASNITALVSPLAIRATIHASDDSTSICRNLAEACTASKSSDWESIPKLLVDHNRYRVIRLIGRGGMGYVWLAEHLVLRRLVALKVLRSDWMEKKSTVERFDREIRAAARLSHPNVATVHDAEQIGDSHVLVMEYVDGQSLADIVSQGPLPALDACRVIRDAAKGLAHAHAAGLIHRDVKPGNIMRAASGEVKILDFGLVVEPDETSSLTGPNLVMGTPDYISPEQAEDPHRADQRSDIYSLGCTFFHLLTARIPFPETSVVRMIDAHRSAPVPSQAVPAELFEIITRMMAKDPVARYSTATDVVAALEPFCDETKAVEVTASTATALRLPPPRQPTVWPGWLAAFLAASLLLGVVYRIQTDNGELVIVADEDVEVSIRQGGKEVNIYDTKSQQKLVLSSGIYDLELKNGPAGLKLDIEKASLKRGEVTVARIEYIPRKKKAVEPGPWPTEMTEVRRFTEGLEKPEWRARVAFGPDGNTVYAASNHYPRAVLCWDTNTGALKSKININGEGFSVRLSPNGNLLTYQDAVNFGFLVVNTQDGKVLQRLKGPTSYIERTVAVSVDGQRFAAAENFADQTAKIYVWDQRSGQLIGTRQWNEHLGRLAFSSDGTSIAVSKSGGLCIWTVGTDQTSEDIAEKVAWDFTPDGKRLLVSSGYPGNLTLWNVSDKTHVRSYTGHRHQVESIAIAQDGRHFASGSADGTVRWWDLETGKELSRAVAHAYGTLSVAVSPDSKFLLSGGKDGEVRLWRLPDTVALPVKPVAE